MTPRVRWIAVWVRAVVAPAWRRALAAWIGCAIVAAVLFGPTAMRASDLTGLALHDPGVGLVLTAIWLLVLAPTARILVRAAPAAYLRSLPGDPRAARAVTAAALIGLQLPWLALWIVGEGLLGAAIVVATTLPLVVIARWRPPSIPGKPPAWQHAGTALRAVHGRALRRRAADALVRGAGLAVLAGLAAGLVVAHNDLSGVSAGVLGAAIIAVVLVPAQVGPALVTIGAYRETSWLTESLGVASRTRITALVAGVAKVHLAAAAIAAATAMIVAGPHPWLPILALGVGAGTALAEVRTILVSAASPTVAARMVVGAIVAAGLAVVCLTVLDAAGALAFLAIAAFAVLVAAP